MVWEFNWKLSQKFIFERKKNWKKKTKKKLSETRGDFVIIKNKI